MRTFFALIAAVLLAASPLAAAWAEGVAAFNAGRYRDAATEFRAVVDRSPEAPEGHYMLGLSLLRQERTSQALESLGQAVALRPEEADYRLALAQANLVAGRADDALAALADLDPASVTAERRPAYGQLLARAAAGSERPEAAAAALERAMDAGLRSKPLWLARAHVARRLGRVEDELAALIAAFELDPGDAELGRRAVRTAFATAQDLAGDDRRRRYLEGARIAEGLATGAPSPEHLLLAGEARMGAQDYAAARRWFDQAAAADGADPLPRYYAGRCDLALGETEGALGAFDAALALSPDAGLKRRILTARGSALRRLERFDEAAAAYRLSGDEEKAAEMEGLARIQRDNLEWQREKRKCEEKKRKIEQELEEQNYLEGTEAWRQLQRDAAKKLADCHAYLGGED